MPSPETIDIAERIRAMSPADRLRLAADLLDAGRLALARSISEDTALELAAIIMRGKMPR